MDVVDCLQLLANDVLDARQPGAGWMAFRVLNGSMPDSQMPDGWKFWVPNGSTFWTLDGYPPYSPKPTKPTHFLSGNWD